jgi:hypothetical protein
MEAQLVAFGLKLLDRGNEVQPDRARERRLDQKPGPAGLLDEVDGVAVGQLGLGARDARPEPFAEVGRPADVDEEGVGHAEIAADGPDAGQTVGDADSVIDVPTK